MCYHFSLATPRTKIESLFGLDGPAPVSAAPRYHIAPSVAVHVLRMVNGVRELASLRWGLIPHWNTHPKPKPFANARAETAPDKPAFRDPFRWRRCLVPADGFFEWETVGKKKRPHFVRPLGGGMFVYAGLWDRWMSPEGPIDTVAVLTVPANELVKPLHDRMPAILAENQFAVWLNPKETRPAHLLPLLTPVPGGPDGDVSGEREGKPRHRPGRAGPRCAGR